MIDFVNSGSTGNSVNFPKIQVSELQRGHRLIHIHHNVSGVLAQIDKVLADHDINIIGQFLKTSDTIGYVITDIDKKYSKDVLNALREIEATIKTRVLY